MAKVFVTREIPEKGITLLKGAGHEVTIAQKGEVLTPEELREALAVKPYDAVLSTLSDRMGAAELSVAPAVKIIANYAVGFDNIDLHTMKERGVVVTNTPDVLTDAVAEHTIALAFALAKRIPEADRFTRAGKYAGWGPMLMLGTELKGKTFGIIGAGRIGSQVLKAAQCMGMRVIYNDLQPNETIEKEVGAVFEPHLEALLKEADVVSLHVPLLDATRHLINKERLHFMKPTAFLINTSRGPVVDETALVAALKANIIRGAALDVFENEPALAPGLAVCENVILTPHTASATEEARSAMSEMAAKSIIDFFDGTIPQHVVV